MFFFSSIAETDGNSRILEIAKNEPQESPGKDSHETLIGTCRELG